MAETLIKNYRQLYPESLTYTAASIFGKKLGFLAKLFGCSHKNLSRPFSHNNIGYRTCIQCGARTKFDVNSRTTHGGFYYPPPASRVESS